MTGDEPNPRLPSISDIEAAQRRISGVASVTPLVESPGLTKRFGREVYLKLECFQPIRAFKIRGAYNKISQLKERNVVAVSSGNHGMAVAYSCRAFGKRCTIVLPEDAVQEKVDAISEYGAEIVRVGRYHPERAARAEQIVRETGAAYVHPFDDAAVIAGQGTCGMEIADQLESFDSVVVPVGGGGLISGISIALKARRPRLKVFGVEPKGSPKLSASLRAGKVVILDNPETIADGIISPTLGDLTFEACSKYVDGVFSVSDDEILEAMKLLIREARIFPEPAGAASLAAAVAGVDSERLGDRAVFVVSGGNVSRKLLLDILQSQSLG